MTRKFDVDETHTQGTRWATRAEAEAALAIARTQLDADLEYGLTPHAYVRDTDEAESWGVQVYEPDDSPSLGDLREIL